MRGTSVKRTTNWATGPNNNLIPFDTVEYDDDGLWAPSAPTRLGPVPASYDGLRAVIYAMGIWLNDINTYAELKVFRNGVAAEPVGVAQHQYNANNTGVHLVTRPIVLAEGDYFELVGRSGDAGTLYAAPAYSVTFAIEVRTPDGGGPPAPTIVGYIPVVAP